MLFVCCSRSRNETLASLKERLPLDTGRSKARNPLGCWHYFSKLNRYRHSSHSHKDSFIWDTELLLQTKVPEEKRVHGFSWRANVKLHLSPLLTPFRGLGYVHICNAAAPHSVLPWKHKLLQMDFWLLFLITPVPKKTWKVRGKKAPKPALSLVCLHCVSPDTSLPGNKLTASLGKSVTLWVIYQPFPRLKNKHLLINTIQLKSCHCCITSCYAVFLCCSSCARKNWTMPRF